MLVYCLRYWPSIDPTKGRLVFFSRKMLYVATLPLWHPCVTTDGNGGEYMSLYHLLGDSGHNRESQEITEHKEHLQI